MPSARFHPERPPLVGVPVRINAGQFCGHEGRVSRIDEQERVVHFTIMLFDRPVELRLDFDTAADILDVGE